MLTDSATSYSYWAAPYTIGLWRKFKSLSMQKSSLHGFQDCKLHCTAWHSTYLSHDHWFLSISFIAWRRTAWYSMGTEVSLNMWDQIESIDSRLNITIKTKNNCFPLKIHKVCKESFIIIALFTFVHKQPFHQIKVHAWVSMTTVSRLAACSKIVKRWILLILSFWAQIHLNGIFKTLSADVVQTSIFDHL